MVLPMFVFTLALLVACASSSPLHHAEEEEARIGSLGRTDNEYRLPSNTAPISYTIRLITELEDFSFDGEVEIFLQVLETTQTITLHTNALTCNETLTTLVSQDGELQGIVAHNYDTDKHFLSIAFENELLLGNYNLSLSFTGVLAEDTYGFYRSSYVNASGDTVWLAATHFQPIHARRAFPCFDEPSLKATFNVEIKHDTDLHALSNMPIAEKYVDAVDGKSWTIFEESPLMSTYSVAFVVSDFAVFANSDESYSIWSRPDVIDQAQYAYDVGALALAEFASFTNINYALPKLDQILIPNLPTDGADNWGLVAYRENTILYEENISTINTQQFIATTISHQFSRQWFGSLVSPVWWKYLWLNEGFATYFEYFTTDVVKNNWRLIDQFVVQVQQASALAADASASSHPMNQEVSSPSEISSSYDSISNSKAASVIRMMSHFLTENVFRAGLTNFLDENAFSAASSDDLFEALHEAAIQGNVLPQHFNVKDIMNSWVDQMGYPVVTVTRNYSTRTSHITQERFLIDDVSSTDSHDYRWWIPINWVSRANPDFSSTAALDWIRMQDESVMLSGFVATNWLIFNKQQTGYYRVNYDPTNWKMIADYLDSDQYLNIHVLNRAGLIDDAFHLAKANRLSYSVVLDLTFYLQREIDYIPWYPAFAGFRDLNRLLGNTEQYESFRTYLAFLTSNVFDSVGMEETENDDHTTRLNRINVINYACYFGLESCRLSTENQITSWLDDSTVNSLSPNLLSTTICAGLRSANAATWNRAFDKYLTSESVTEQSALLAGLGCSESETIINDWLKAIIDPTTGLSTLASSSAFIHVYEGSTYNVDLAFNFIVDNVDSIIAYFDGNSELQTFVTGIGYRMSTETQLEKLNTFVTAQSANLGTAGTIAIGYVQSNIAWDALHGDVVGTWIANALLDLEDDDGIITTTTEDVDTTTTDSTTTTEIAEDVDTTTSIPTTTEMEQNVDTTTIGIPTTTGAEENVYTPTTGAIEEEDYETTTVDNSAVTVSHSFLAVILTLFVMFR